MTTANPYDQLGSAYLTQLGLNMQAVFALSALPAPVARKVRELLDNGDCDGYLLLLGNGGRTYWDNVSPAAWQQQHPLDQHAVQSVEHYLQAELPGSRYQILYPGEFPVGLQQLGLLAGWHSNSPLKLGINPVFGLWYAYRALVWVERGLSETEVIDFESPCSTCINKPCVQSCPVDALSGAQKMLDRCIDFRLTVDSPCQSTCLARLQCPVAQQHRYSEQQLNYHYQQSYQTIVNWRR